MPLASRSSVLTTLAAAVWLHFLEAATEEAASLEAAEDAVEDAAVEDALLEQPVMANSQHGGGKCQTQSTIDSHVIVSFYSKPYQLLRPA